MRWPLRNQILLPFTSIMLLVIIAVTASNAYFAAEDSAGRIQRQMRAIGATLRESRFPLTEAVLQQAKGLSGAEFVVTDSKGVVQAQTVGVAAAAAWKAVAELAQGRADETVSLDGIHYVRMRIERAANDNEPPLQVHVLYPLATWTELQRRAVLPPIVVGLIAVLLVVLFSIGLAHRISSPLQSVVEQVTRIARQHPRPLPVPRTDDEVRRLVESVNGLVSELDARNQAIQRSERLTMLGKLSGGLAHHLRNGVTGASLALQLHRRSCRQIDQESLDVALRQLELTEEHLKCFLAAGQPQPLELRLTNLNDWADEITRLVQPACQHRGVRWSRSIDPDLPLVPLDASQLRQAVCNLAMNAIESVGHGGDVQLEIAGLPDGRTAIRVVDSGPGPTAEMESRLFEPFATSKPEGIGLGLVVARQIAEAHGGTLHFIRRDGRCCFELLLPPAATAHAAFAGHSIAATTSRNDRPESTPPYVHGEPV